LPKSRNIVLATFGSLPKSRNIVLPTFGSLPKARNIVLASFGGLPKGKNIVPAALGVCPKGEIHFGLWEFAQSKKFILGFGHLSVSEKPADRILKQMAGRGKNEINSFFIF
jgi:hypothetical protein